jgi:[acyl-carrier-protein] S-malonyltransferase
MHHLLPDSVHLHFNPHRWPPMHTPILWQRNIPNRASVMMQTIKGGFQAPLPRVFSLATGAASYNDYNCREILAQWIDHPQRLWDAVYATLAEDIETVVHVGPEPNLIPATFDRLAKNVQVQLAGRTIGGLSLRAVSGIAGRAWLRALLPSRAALLRAPRIKQIVLEDWLLEQKVP